MVEEQNNAKDFDPWDITWSEMNLMRKGLGLSWTNIAQQVEKKGDYVAINSLYTYVSRNSNENVKAIYVNMFRSIIPDELYVKHLKMIKMNKFEYMQNYLNYTIAKWPSKK